MLAFLCEDELDGNTGFCPVTAKCTAMTAQDACKMEHELSPETIAQIRLFSAYLKSSPKAGTIVHDFEGFLKRKGPR